MKNNWLKDIHDRLGSYEKDAPDGLWEDIKKNIGVNGGCIQTGKSPVSRRLRRAAGVAVAASVALLLGYSVYSTRYANNVQNTPGTAETHVYATTAKTSDKGLLAQENNDGITAKSALPDKNRKPDNSIHRDHKPETEVVSSTAHTDENASPKTSSGNGSAEAKETRENKPANGNNYTEHTYTNHISNHSDTRRLLSSSMPSRWTVSASAMGATGASKTTMSTGSPVVATGPDDSDWEDNPMLGISTFNQGKDVKTEYKHHLPVRVGVKVAYAFNERLSIESGLTYTRLSSDMKDGTQENYYTGKQKLNYVGIPVNLKCNVFSYKRVSLYGSAGVLAEKCVSGNVTEEYVINNATKKTETVGIDSKPVQMSVNASAGVQLNVFSNIGVYAEPGLSYYFDDRSSLQTIYKEKPLNFSLNVGVRCTIGK